MRSYYYLRSSQNRSPPAIPSHSFIAQAEQLSEVGSLYVKMVLGMCGREGRNFMHKENKKWL